MEAEKRGYADPRMASVEHVEREVGRICSYLEALPSGERPFAVGLRGEKYGLEYAKSFLLSSFQRRGLEVKVLSNGQQNPESKDFRIYDIDKGLWV